MIFSNQRVQSNKETQLFSKYLFHNMAFRQVKTAS